MIILELYAFGRILRVRLSPSWRWWAACCGGTVLIETGPMHRQREQIDEARGRT